jgi:hypothetical protein
MNSTAQKLYEDYESDSINGDASLLWDPVKKEENMM